MIGRPPKEFFDHFKSGMTASELAKAAKIKVELAVLWIGRAQGTGIIYQSDFAGRFARYNLGSRVSTNDILTPEFKTYTPPPPSIIPVRAGNTIAPDLSDKRPPAWMVSNAITR